MTHVVPVATNTQHGPSARVKALAAFELAHDESRGRPVAMLLREGRWLAADRWFSHAQVDAVFAQLHLQVETDVKAALKNVNPRELLTRRQAEPLLYMVATCGFDRAIPDVMEVGSSQMRTSDDSTALHIAAGGGYREVVRALLATGAKPRPLDDRRISPIDLGLWAGHIDLVCDLLGDKPHPEDLRRALQLALDLGNTAALRRLLAVGGERVVKGLHPEDFGRTLEVADPEIVQRLIQLGMPLNDERALLHAAASGNAAVVQTLLDAGARADRTAPDRTSAVHIAAARGSVAVIEALYRAGADLNAANKFGESPLGVAARAGHTASVTFLTRHGATVNSVAEHEPRRDPKTRWITDCLRPEAERVFSEDDVDLPPRVTMIARIAVSRELSVNWNSTQTTQYGTNPFTGEVTTYNQTQAVPTYSSEGHGSTWAVASMIVEADGSVSHVFTVAANSEETRLAVDKAVDQYRFEPGEREGRKVRTRVTLPILVN